MTVDERRTTLIALWRAVRTLVPAKAHEALTDLQVAIESTYNDHADLRVSEAYRDGRQADEATLDAVRREGFREGMLAVTKRSDYRDLEDVGDPEELRSTH